MSSLTVQQSFEEQIKNRLREDIGKLMPDEQLSRLIEEAISKIFFTRIQEGYGNSKPSWFEQEVNSVLSGKIREHITLYMEKNQDEVARQISNGITATVPAIFGAMISGMISNNTWNFSQFVGNIVSDAIQRGTINP